MVDDSHHPYTPYTKFERLAILRHDIFLRILGDRSSKVLKSRVHDNLSHRSPVKKNIQIVYTVFPICTRTLVNLFIETL